MGKEQRATAFDLVRYLRLSKAHVLQSSYTLLFEPFLHWKIMGNARQFFIISLIIHLLVFLILAYITLPPVDRYKEFLDSLSIDFVELKKPVIRELEPVREESEQEQAEISTASQIPEPPEPGSFSLPMGEAVTESVRAISSQRTPTFRKMQGETGMASGQPLAVKPIPRSTDDADIAAVPDLQQGSENLAGEGEGKGFTGLQPSPFGGAAGAKGQGEQFITAYASSMPPRENRSKFSDILPDLADGILERATQKKIDVIFIIDTTGSMRDNVRGVRDYIHSFVEPIEEGGFDAALGLVEFTDLEIKKAKAAGLTRNQGKFRKWLDKIVFFGGTDLPESGYEAMLTALQDIDFRKDAQRFFIFISDAPQHDMDYDGKSRYSLDRIITILNNAGVQVDVVGANYLPIKQLARGTGGQWKHIPGGDPVTDIPYPISSMIHSRLESSLEPVMVEDTVTIEFGDLVPDWVDLSYKMLDPMGLKCLGTLTYRKRISSKAESKVEFVTKIDLRKFRDQPGTYTLIYRIRDSVGNRDVLRRTLTLRPAA